MTSRALGGMRTTAPALVSRPASQPGDAARPVYTKEEAKRLSAAGLAEVRRLGALGLHVDAQAAQEIANGYWLHSLGRPVNDLAPPPAGWLSGENVR